MTPTTPDDSAPIPLSVFDVVPISEGSSPQEAIRNSLNLAVAAEQAGYRRYWMGEHHLWEGIAGSAAHTLLPAIGERTSHIRIGTAVTVLNNYSLVQVAEAFGVLSALFPGRVDLGLGRPAGSSRGRENGDDASAGRRVGAGAAALSERLLRGPGVDAASYDRAIQDLLDLFAGTSLSPEVGPFVAPPANGAQVQLWLHGQTAGLSAQIAGHRGLPFGVNHLFSLSETVATAATYRQYFRQSEHLTEPRVIVSVELLVAETESRARHLAKGYDHLTLSVMAPGSRGAIRMPSPEWADANPLSDSQQAILNGARRFRLVGAPEQVVDKLDELRRVTGADELLVASTTHDHAERVRSHELLAQAWLG